MKEKKLLIVEHSTANLNIIEESNEQHSDSIVLTGLFTTFNTKNRNGRIYESADFLPHVEALREQISSGRLLGELDHPHGFEIALKNASHVVEALDYDPQQNAIIGRIRLLNTDAGRNAQALVRDGIPLNISSRAAGTVDESGHVRLQQLFTYDLVADPGFANAVLTRVNEGVEVNPISDESRKALQAINESYNYINENYTKVISGDDYDVYELSEDSNTNLDPDVVKTADYAAPQAVKNEDTLNNKDMEDNNQFISYPDFQKYTEHLSEIITDLQSAISNYRSEFDAFKADSKGFDASKIDNSMIADLIAKEVAKVAKPEDGAPVVETPAVAEAPAASADDEKVAELEAKAAAMEEKYNNLEKYVKYIAETLDRSITHQDYIASEANKIIEHNNYLAENLNNAIAHQDYLAENMNKMIAHQDYLAENINDTIAYQNYVAEMLDKDIDYTNMLAEEQNKTIAHADYLAEKMNQMIEHQDYIVEEVNKMGGDIIVEKAETAENSDAAETVEVSETVETVETESVENTEETVVEESVAPEVKVEKPAFDPKAYQSALDEKLTALINQAKEQYAEARRLEEERLAEAKKSIDTPNFNLINCMPTRLQESWMKLSDERKKEILNESKLFTISNPQAAEYFWCTRDLRESKVTLQKIDAEATAAPATPVNENAVSDERLKAMSEVIKKRLGRY